MGSCTSTVISRCNVEALLSAKATWSLPPRRSLKKQSGKACLGSILSLFLLPQPPLSVAQAGFLDNSFSLPCVAEECCAVRRAWNASFACELQSYIYDLQMEPLFWESPCTANRCWPERGPWSRRRRRMEALQASVTLGILWFLRGCRV